MSLKISSQRIYLPEDAEKRIKKIKGNNDTEWQWEFSPARFYLLVLKLRAGPFLGLVPQLDGLRLARHLHVST